LDENSLKDKNYKIQEDMDNLSSLISVGKKHILTPSHKGNSSLRWLLGG
jgi:hypothetical protein